MSERASVRPRRGTYHDSLNLPGYRLNKPCERCNLVEKTKGPASAEPLIVLILLVGARLASDLVETNGRPRAGPAQLARSRRRQFRVLPLPARTRVRALFASM